MSALYWVLIGIGCFIGEAALPVFFFLWFGISALIVAAAAWLGLMSTLQQVMLFSLLAIPLVLASHTVFKKYLMRGSPGEHMRHNAEALAGKTALVLAPIQNHQAQGMVSLDGMEWSARSHLGDDIPAGVSVSVVSVDGVKLVVTPISAEE